MSYPITHCELPRTASDELWATALGAAIEEVIAQLELDWANDPDPTPTT